jgi:hypothetical protein
MPRPPGITVTGRATRRVVPDIATWSATVDGRGETQREAFAACSAKLSELTTAVAGQAPDGAEVSAGGIFVHPEWDERGKRRIGYLAGAAVTIRGSLQVAGELGQFALDAGAIRLDGPIFEIAERSAIRDELLADAVVASRATAERMAAAAGRSVGAAVRIDDSPHDAQPGWTAYAPRAQTMSAQADAPPLAPEAQELEATVSVTFELLD